MTNVGVTLKELGGSMRIALVHSFYSQSVPSGENRVVEDQTRALIRAGHDVQLLSRETDQLVGPMYGIRSAVRVASGRGANPLEALRELGPDVVHIHNLFPNFGTNWIAHWRGPVVHTVHNYRAVCSNGLLYRGGAVCVECPQEDSTRALKYRCYRGSLTATVPVWVSRPGYRARVLQGVDAVVTTSEKSDLILKQSLDFPLETEIIPNFGATDQAEAGVPVKPRFWIAVGRFTYEKGFLELVRDWPMNERLVLVGDGPLSEEIHEAVKTSGRDILVLGSLPIDALRAKLGQAFGFIFPSRWFEVDPQVVVEAMRLGVPVVAFEVNAGAQGVEVSGGGAVYADRSTLVKALERVASNRDQMSTAAMAFYESQWSPTIWLERIEGLYERVVRQSPFRSKHG